MKIKEVNILILFAGIVLILYLSYGLFLLGPKIKVVFDFASPLQMFDFTFAFTKKNLILEYLLVILISLKSFGNKNYFKLILLSFLISFISNLYLLFFFSLIVFSLNHEDEEDELFKVLLFSLLIFVVYNLGLTQLFYLFIYSILSIILLKNILSQILVMNFLLSFVNLKIFGDLEISCLVLILIMISIFRGKSSDHIIFSYFLLFSINSSFPFLFSIPLLLYSFKELILKREGEEIYKYVLFVEIFYYLFLMIFCSNKKEFFAWITLFFFVRKLREFMVKKEDICIQN